MKLPLLILALALSKTAMAGEGVQLALGLGYGQAEIANPDDTKALYHGLNLAAFLGLPLAQSENFELVSRLGFRYADLENNVNNGVQSEFLKMSGPGLGVSLRAYRLFAAAEYHWMRVKSRAQGAFNGTFAYPMSVLSYSAGLEIPLKNFSVTAVYSLGSGSVPKAKSGLTEDSPFQENVYWLNLIYHSGAKSSHFLRFLF